MQYTGKNGAYFEVLDIDQRNCEALKNATTKCLTLLWFQEDGNELVIDSVTRSFGKNQITCLTTFHQLEIESISKVKVLKFNKPFYCVVDHDSQVGCKGILYYGASSLPIFTVQDQDLYVLETVWKMLSIEMESKDTLQLEMLQMMLKRILILCTRIYKNQIDIESLDTTSVDLVREFNYLVENHFRTNHSVASYAELLHKSPKTLSNLFKKIGNKTPLEFIQNRIILEAKNLLTHTKKGISDVAYEVGYEDVQSFSRFFKKKAGMSPSEFKSKSTVA